VLVNNVLGLRQSPDGVGVDTGTWPRYAASNVFLGVGTGAGGRPFGRATGAAFSDPNAADQPVCGVSLDSVCEHATVTGNVVSTLDWAELFVAPAGATGDVQASLAANDWHVAAGDPGGLRGFARDISPDADPRSCLTAGPVDGVSPAPGATAAMALCGWSMAPPDAGAGLPALPHEGVDLDFDRTARAATPTTGAFE
jgi:hypothetical protein